MCFAANESIEPTMTEFTIARDLPDMRVAAYKNWPDPRTGCTEIKRFTLPGVRPMQRIAFSLIMVAILSMQAGCWVSRRCPCRRPWSPSRSCSASPAGNMLHSSSMPQPAGETVHRSLTDEGDILSEGTETEDAYRLPPVPTPPVPVEQQDI